MSNNNLPEVIDLFSGCGGLALGFQSAGFHITHGIELVKEAVETASYNLHWRYGEETGHICGDITELTPDLFKDQIGENGCIVIGGPPCQAYSLAGRAKLRSLGEHRVNTKDKRGYLYQDFLRFAIELDARAVVMENVPEAVNYGGENIPQIVCEILDQNGYDAYWTILNAADFGVPQLRERVFVLAIRRGEKGVIELPKPTHSSHDDKKTQNQMRFNSFSEYTNFKVPNYASDELPLWVSTGEALGDLPELFPTQFSKYVLNRINMPMDYKCEPQNDFQTQMRNWYGREMSMVTGRIGLQGLDAVHGGGHRVGRPGDLRIAHLQLQQLGVDLTAELEPGPGSALVAKLPVQQIRQKAEYGHQGHGEQRVLQIPDREAALVQHPLNAGDAAVDLHDADDQQQLDGHSAQDPPCIGQRQADELAVDKKHSPSLRPLCADDISH